MRIRACSVTLVASALLLVACAGPAAPPAPDVNRAARLEGLGCPVPNPDGGAPPGPVAYVTHGVSDYIAELALPVGSGTGLTVNRCIDVYRHKEFVNEPYDVAVSADGSTLYVVLSHAEGRPLGALLRYRVADLALTGEAPLGTEPSMLRLDEARHRAYVTLYRNLGLPSSQLYEAGGLVAVNLDSMSEVGEVDVGVAALGFDVDPVRQEAYVACFGGNVVSVVNVASDNLVEAARVPVAYGGVAGSYPAYVALAQGSAFVTAAGSSDLYRFDPSSRAFTAELRLGESVMPQRIVATAGGSRLLVALAAGAEVAEVDAATMGLIDLIPTPGLHPEGLAAPGDGSYAVGSDEGDFTTPGHAFFLSVAGPDGGSSAVTTQLQLGVYPQAVTLRP
jgi:DNA-binding beta-propeller fold protein YncE